MRVILQILSFVLLITANLGAQTGSNWLQFSYDRSGHTINLTSDGGYIDAQHAGWIYDLAPMQIQKFDSSANLQWQKTYSSKYGLMPFSIAETSDGGFVIGGSLYEPPAFHIFVLKLDPLGNSKWIKALNLNDNYGRFDDVRETSDGGYIGAGTGCLNGCRIIISKFDSNGNVKWQKISGPGDYRSPRKVIETADGDYLVSGTSDQSGAGLIDIFVVKLNASGAVLWQRNYGTADDDLILDFQKTIGGELVLIALSNHEPTLINLDSSGNIQWQYKYSLHSILSFSTTQDQGFLISGRIVDDRSIVQAAFLKVDSLGNPNLFEVFPGLDLALAAKEKQDGGYLLAGSSYSWLTRINASWFAAVDSDWNLECVQSQSQNITFQSADLVSAQANESFSDAITSELPITLAEFNGTASPSLFCPSLFYDDFNDGILDQNWTYTGGGWREDRDLSGSSGSAIASPAFGGCDLCSIEADIGVAYYGLAGKISLLGWFKDDKNYVEVLLNAPRQRVTVRQRLNGEFVRKHKSPFPLDTSTGHHVKVTFNGDAFNLYVDNVFQLKMRSFPGSLPFGTAGFQLKRYSGSFDSLAINPNSP